MLQWVVAGAWSVGRTGVRKGAYVGYVMNAVRYPPVGQSTVTSTKYKRAGIALLPFGSASTLNCQSQLLIGSLDFWSNALDCAWSVAPIFIAEVALAVMKFECLGAPPKRRRSKQRGEALALEMRTAPM